MERITMPPGVAFSAEGGGFERFRPLVRAASGLTLGQVCAISGLEPSTVQNWVKRGFVPHPVAKKYQERQLARILLISALRDGMQIDSIGELLRLVNGDTEDESDDIIPEDRLYDCLCRIIARMQKAIPLPEELPALVAEAAQDYEPPDPEAAERLRQALAVMTAACVAGKYRQEAELRFRGMKENRQED